MNKRKPDREAYWMSLGLALLIIAELVLFGTLVHGILSVAKLP